MKVSEAWTLVENDRRFRTSIANLQSDLRIDIGNRIDKFFYEEMRKIYPFFFRTTTSLTVNASNLVHTISDLLTLRGQDLGVFYTDANDAITTRRLPRTAPGATVWGYFWDSKNSQLNFTGEPDDVFIVAYIPNRTEIGDQDDDLQLPDDNPDVIFTAFKRAYELWRAGQEINLADAEFRNAIFSMIDRVRADATGGLETNSVKGVF